MANDAMKYDPADTNRDGAIDKKEAAAWRKKGSKNVSAESLAADYGYAAALISSDETGSLQNFFDWFSSYTKRTGRVPTENELNRRKRQTEWFNRYNANQQEALKDKALDPTNYEASVKLHADDIRATAENLGIPLTDAQVNELANQSRINKWSKVQIQNNLAPYLKSAVGAGTDLMGAAGDAQAQIKDWAAQQGLDLTDQAAAKYVENVTLGKQSLNDVQAELRKLYLSGTYPAYRDMIDAGYDPSVIADPYQQRAARMLGKPSVSITDPLIQKAMQYVGPDGKPSVLPIYEFDRMVRGTDEWKKSEDGMATYNNALDSILGMFGFR